MKIAIIGKGNVGTALSLGLKRAGHEIRFGHRDPKETVRSAAEWGEIIVLAVPFTTIKQGAYEIGSLAEGKTVIDVSNTLDVSGDWAIGFSTSGAEELQKVMPKARVVKAFNTVFAKHQSTGHVGDKKLSAFVASNDEEAKKSVMNLAADIGFEPVDAGMLRAARYLEAMGMFIISLEDDLRMGTDIGLSLIKT